MTELLYEETKSSARDVRRRCSDFDDLIETLPDRPAADPVVASMAAMRLCRESRLLDARRYDQWLSEWAPDGLWWLPIDHRAPDATAQSLAFDDVRRLRERVAWMTDPVAWSQHPSTRTVRSVGAVEAWIDRPGELVATSSLMITTVRRSVLRTTAARQVLQYVTSPTGEGDHLRRKAILLVDSDQGQPNPGFLL